MPFNDVYRCINELMAVSLPLIESPLIMKLDEADLMCRSYVREAIYQSAVIACDLISIIAAYHYIFNHSGILTGVAFNGVLRCKSKLITMSLSPIEIPLKMNFDESHFMFRSFKVCATFQSDVIVSELGNVIAAYHYIFNH